jgi:hypothetical protein
MAPGSGCKFLKFDSFRVSSGLPKFPEIEGRRIKEYIMTYIYMHGYIYLSIYRSIDISTIYLSIYIFVGSTRLSIASLVSNDPPIIRTDTVPRIRNPRASNAQSSNQGPAGPGQQ